MIALYSISLNFKPWYDEKISVFIYGIGIWKTMHCDSSMKIKSQVAGIWTTILSIWITPLRICLSCPQNKAGRLVGQCRGNGTFISFVPTQSHANTLICSCLLTSQVWPHKGQFVYRNMIFVSPQMKLSPIHHLNCCLKSIAFLCHWLKAVWLWKSHERTP